MARRLELSRARSGEVRMGDHGSIVATIFPVAPRPFEPAVLLLIEDEKRLVAQLGELGAPAGSATHGAIVENDADDVDLLAVVDLVPECLQHPANCRTVRVAAVHQP